MDRIGRLGFEWVDIGMVRNYCPHFDPMTATESETDSFVEMIRGTGLKVATLNVGYGALNRPEEREAQKVFVKRCLGLFALYMGR